MTSADDAIPEDALADIDYLSRSANRVAILNGLADGATTRRELADRTGVSRATLDRIVNEFEERGWAERTPDGEYVATAAGVHVVREFRPFVESVAAVERLGEAVAWLPTDELDIGLHEFGDATVRRPENDDPAEAVEFMTGLLRESDEFRTLNHLLPPGIFERVLHDQVVSGELSVEAVTTRDVVDYFVESPGRRERWRDVLKAGTPLFYRDPPIPCNLLLFDDLVLIKRSDTGPIDDSYGVPIVSENEAVLSWAHDLIDRYRADAVRVDTRTLTEVGAASDER
jgi:predicted transcriptional regulator